MNYSEILIGVLVDAPTNPPTTDPTTPTEPDKPAKPNDPNAVIDPCTGRELDSTPIEASELCNTLATIEGNGTYTQHGPSTSTASGRYQIIDGTGAGQLVKLGYSHTEASSLWQKCKLSASEECKRIQDKVCNSYSHGLQKELKRRGIPVTKETLYLAWNQGAGGANVIWRSIQSGQPVTNPRVLRGMHKQAWKFSPDGATFYKNMQGYMRKKGAIS